MELYHDSRRPDYRSPSGAVPVGTGVRLALDVTNPVPGMRCFLRVWEGARGAALVPMECGSWGETVRFSAGITAPEEGCLLWYSFVAEWGEERLSYGNGPEELGGVGARYQGAAKSYQITVYRPGKLPRWYREGVAYQIFPDRFFRGVDWLERQKAALRPAGWKGPRRVLQLDWDDVPFYGRDEAGDMARWPFFGGTLEGILEKLPYLHSLGVTILYLNPIFAAASSHRYDTADYLRVDPMLGDEAGFSRLAARAGELGIRIILDGVFSHTGADSRYFDRWGNHGGAGAAQSRQSPYFDWYRFRAWPEDYECWWGVKDLPNVEELDPGYRRFLCGEDGVVRRWLRLGASGWRLDVADELPDQLIRDIRRAMEAENPDSLLLGEVWEDASHKESYGRLREYFLGEELHCAMNYPFRTAAIDFMLGRLDGAGFRDRLMSLQENYPPEQFYGAWNLVGSHDRVRILTLLGEAPEEETLTAERRERFRLAPERYDLARRRLMLLTLIQFTMPGVPCIYYGDEAGAEGYSDPLNRGTFPWGREDGTLLEHHRALARLRRAHPALVSGLCRFQAFTPHVYGCLRRGEGETVQILANRGIFEHQQVTLFPGGPVKELLSGQVLLPDAEGALTVELPPLTGLALSGPENWAEDR